MLIMNEKKYVESIVESDIVPSDISISKLITLLTKYYYNLLRNEEDVVNMVQMKMQNYRFDITEYQEYKWTGRIISLYRRIDEGKINKEFKELDFIPLYKSEKENIEGCETDREKKLLCTMYIMARFHNLDGWVNTDFTTLFKLANISVTNDVKVQMIRKLISYGFVSMSKKVDNLNLQVIMSNPNEDVEVLRITELKNIGVQYLAATKPGHKACENCGKLIKIKGNKTKYCKKCAEEVNREKTKNNMKQQRN